MSIILINAHSRSEQLIRNHPDTIGIVVPGEQVRQRLQNATSIKPETTLLIDAELKTTGNSLYQRLEGLKLAYECRVNPEVRFRGFIRLFGFMPGQFLKQSRFGGLIRSGERIHDRKFELKGAEYLRYPAFDPSEGPPLSSDEWDALTSELDEIFVQEFSRFNHGFRNVTLLEMREKETVTAKREELESFLNLLKYISKTTVVPERYQEGYSDVSVHLGELLRSFEKSDRVTRSRKLAEIRKSITNLVNHMKNGNQ